MSAVVPNEADLDALRAIARCGFDRDEILRICAAAGWELLDEIPDAKMLQYRAKFGSGKQSDRVVTIHREDDGMAPTASVPLRLFRLNPSPARQVFDEAFQVAADGLTVILGTPHQVGTYRPRHRPRGRFRYAWWRLADAAVVLVQNQFDAESDLDVSLWVFPPLDEIKLPVTSN